MEITFDNLQTPTIIEKNICRVTSSELSRCYNCVTEADWKYSCSTNFGNALAYVNCIIALYALCKQ